MMAIFHDEDEGPDEPVPGLPQALPADEVILWQGGADTRTLARHAFHVRSIGIYFLAAAVLRGVVGVSMGQPLEEVLRTSAMIGALGLFAIAVLAMLAWAMARRALFTITSKRVVIRHGVAIRKYINIPFKDLQSVEIRRHGSGFGDIALASETKPAVPYFHLWPFARPLRFTNTVPLLRAVADVDDVAQRLAAAVKAQAPDRVTVNSGATQTPDRTKDVSVAGAALSPEAL